MAFRCTYRECLVRPLSEKLPLELDVNKCRYTELGNVQTVGDLGTLSPILNVSIKFSHQRVE